jgi:hypothetical protein
MFFFKKQKVYMDAFTSRPEVYEFAPIEKSINYLPTWWKSLPKCEVSFENYDSFRQRSMKHCIGFLNYFKKSYVIPMWSDLNLQIGKEGTLTYRWQFADHVSSIEVHHAVQRGAYLDEHKYQHFKLSSPWTIKTNKLIYFSWSGAVWNLEEPEKIICFPAVTEYYNQSATAINIACKRDVQTKEIFIPFRQPLVHIIPMTEKDVVLKTHLVSNSEIKKIENSTFYGLSFINSYSKIKKIKDAT